MQAVDAMSKDKTFNLRLDATDRARLDEIAKHYSAPAATAVRMLIKKEYDQIEAASRLYITDAARTAFAEVHERFAEDLADEGHDALVRALGVAWAEKVRWARPRLPVSLGPWPGRAADVLEFFADSGSPFVALDKKGTSVDPRAAREEAESVNAAADAHWNEFRRPQSVKKTATKKKPK